MLLGAIAGGGLVLALVLRRRTAGPPAPRSFDLPHILELLAKAHAARAGWAIGLVTGSIDAAGSDAETRARGEAFVRVASMDGRVHVAREAEGTYVATGDFPYGAALLFPQSPSQEAIEAALEDLRRFIETMRRAESEVATAQRGNPGPGDQVGRQLALGVAGTQTLEGIARAGAELAQQIAELGAAVVVRAGEDENAQIIAVSTRADKRLAGRRLQSDAPVSRALQTGVPVVTLGNDDVFGPGMPERRRHERAGSVYPVMDGRTVVAALVLIGSSAEGTMAAERIASLARELGPRLAAAKAVHEAEQRAVLDHLTGLRNRGEFQRTLDSYRAQKQPPPATLIYVDLDHFKRLNDTLGHAAGDSALKHIARVLEAAVREGDLVARIGGEEFAVWLPRARLPEGLEVAERIRDSIATREWHWAGTRYPLTASGGAAAFPDPIGDLQNLPAAADAALYRAKQAGRNRVEKATLGH
jgi:diguanylate cyclase (GGDEF)-like protein